MFKRMMYIFLPALALAAPLAASPEGRFPSLPKWDAPFDGAVVKVMNLKGSFGTGAVVSADGLVVTAKHVAALFRNHQAVIFEWPDGHKALGHVLYEGPNNDIAVAKIEGLKQRLPYLPIAKQALQPGERVTLWGYSHNIFSPKRLYYDGPLNHVGDYGCNDQRFSSGIDHGDSGGPILNSNDEIVGIGVAKATCSGKNYSFGVDIHDAHSMIPELAYNGDQ